MQAAFVATHQLIMTFRVAALCCFLLLVALATSAKIPPKKEHYESSSVDESNESSSSQQKDSSEEVITTTTSAQAPTTAITPAALVDPLTSYCKSLAKFLAILPESVCDCKTFIDCFNAIAYMMKIANVIHLIDI
ncbi:hypothetical protein DAPPUDRAFT_241305 [Daphnia pulex]|uniref:Uncharacterized protein n=1 Tax=Daphnia pulex TaxID=6669 RepID=E9GDX8_DAPPU|nr:hypothetical protein DAPPUDRAFT_241305 [Daphnia pulex]|eukprot:EFX82406.1 hypothetical protein DAPPUDRAFT_241305 [Daphnia pulex]